MKKILLSAIALMGMVSASAQEATTPYILSQVEANTYAVTMTNDEITAAFDAQWVADAWNMGAALPRHPDVSLPRSRNAPRDIPSIPFPYFLSGVL